MRTLKLTLAYDGADFAGWQRQPGQRTVQGVLETALARITGVAVQAQGSGRTDSGVHALGQVVSFQTNATLAPEVFARALNAELPADVLVLHGEEASLQFHARYDAVGKRYRYVLHDGPWRDLFWRRYRWHCRQALDVERMHRSAQALVGEHDFRSFESNWPNRESSVRTITDISITRGAGKGGATGCPVAEKLFAPFSDETVTLEVAADGFLYNMVRTIVGTLFEVGRGNRPANWPAEVLAAQDRNRAGQTAPAHGLYLLRVEYPPVENSAAG